MTQAGRQGAGLSHSRGDGMRVSLPSLLCPCSEAWASPTEQNPGLHIRYQGRVLGEGGQHTWETVIETGVAPEEPGAK